jgi:copper chaperone CopZ
MKHSQYEVQVADGPSPGALTNWDTAVTKDLPVEAEKVRTALEKVYGPERVRVRKVTTQEVYETIPGKTARGSKDIITSQGVVKVSVTSARESVIRLPERSVVIYLEEQGINIIHPVGANGHEAGSSVTQIDAPLMSHPAP